MSISSSSSKQDASRQEEFKRATANVLRAVAHGGAEVQVAFQPGPGGVAGKRVRLPLPTRALPPAEMAKLRGAADAAALRLRHHDESVHANRTPARREAKEVFDALEQVRVEAVGARHMAGVAANLRARLAEECEAEGYDRMTRKDQLPLPAALSLLAREQLSGEPAPAAARRVLDLWRDTLGEKADAALAEMARAQDSQEGYARAARRLLAALQVVAQVRFLFHHHTAYIRQDRDHAVRCSRRNDRIDLCIAQLPVAQLSARCGVQGGLRFAHAVGRQQLFLRGHHLG